MNINEIEYCELLLKKIGSKIKKYNNFNILFNYYNNKLKNLKLNSVPQWD